MQVNYITNIYSENTGGNVILDVVCLSNGNVLSINDELVVLWKDIDSYNNNDIDNIINSMVLI